MSAFSIRKQSPNQSDSKSPSVAIKSRQQATHDVNKRRTLLQDNSWIKKRPEEERIPARSDTDKINKSPTLNNKENNRRSWTPNASSTNAAVTSPIKKKRQSWMPPPVSSSKTTTETVETKRTTSENSEAPMTAAFSSEQVTPQKSKTDVDDPATARNQDIDNLIKVNSSSFTSDKADEGLGDHTEAKPADDQSKKRITEQAYENPPRTPNNLPETNYSSNSERKTSKSSYGAYEENITGNTIKTVYSTSDRSIIGKDICTYCRKPLGIDAKMILDALQICCHSTCFKCEVCKRPLEDLKAGDSIWIYRQTVHCEPCYSKVKAEKDFLDMIMTELECSEAAGP
ncbi:PREDICTED: sciellin [Charadrius vociferus]|uniref:sciellin n=1 Tax=Charadrius vociferus TaxID=50402 RepID=UPI0005216444|nr:PREDICTED: sciellin [Charadrius vociferus]